MKQSLTLAHRLVHSQSQAVCCAWLLWLDGTAHHPVYRQHLSATAIHHQRQLHVTYNRHQQQSSSTSVPPPPPQSSHPPRRDVHASSPQQPPHTYAADIEQEAEKHGVILPDTVIEEAKHLKTPATTAEQQSPHEETGSLSNSATTSTQSTAEPSASSAAEGGETQGTHDDARLTPINVRAYGSGVFDVNDIMLSGSMMLGKGLAVCWRPQSWSDVRVSDLEFTKHLNPKPELCLLGTGNHVVAMREDLHRFFRENHIQYELFDSGNACATYNILAEEERNVVACVIQTTDRDEYTGEHERRRYGRRRKYT